MRFLLDANAVIGLLGGNAGMLAGVRRYTPQDFGISAVAAHELFYGACRSTSITVAAFVLDVSVVRRLDALVARATKR